MRALEIELGLNSKHKILYFEKNIVRKTLSILGPNMLRISKNVSEMLVNALHENDSL